MRRNGHRSDSGETLVRQSRSMIITYTPPFWRSRQQVWLNQTNVIRQAVPHIAKEIPASMQYFTLHGLYQAYSTTNAWPRFWHNNSVSSRLQPLTPRPPHGRAQGCQDTPITTPLQAAAWEKALSNHLNQEWTQTLLWGMSQGFRISLWNFPIAAPQLPMTHPPWSSMLRWPASSVSKQQPAQHLYLDATGPGALAYPHWFQIQWGRELLASSIAFKDPLPIVMAAAVRGHRWRGTYILGHANN